MLSKLTVKKSFIHRKPYVSKSIEIEKETIDNTMHTGRRKKARKAFDMPVEDKNNTIETSENHE